MKAEQKKSKKRTSELWEPWFFFSCLDLVAMNLVSSNGDLVDC
jgi:hypothetical protein